MASSFRHSYSRVDSTNEVGHKSAGSTINDVQEIPLVAFDTSNDATLRSKEAVDVGPRRQQRWRNLAKVTGWRVGAGFAMLGAFITLILNISTAVYGIKHQEKDTTDSSILVELFHGECKQAGTINTYAHLLINVISTLLLSGSNYCMQCLTAPTRNDVDAAHRRMRWLDIGVPSLRNLKHISGLRRTLWALLVASSLPLHLMFNSVFFTSLATNDYNVIFATENYTTGANFSTSNGFNTVYFQPPLFKENLTEVQRLVEQGRFERLENTDCIKSYAVDLLTDRRTLVVISSNISLHENGAVLGSGNQEYVSPDRWYVLAEGYNPYTWLCSDRDATALRVSNAFGNSYRPYCYKYAHKLASNPDVWAPSNWNPEYCLSEKVEGQCSCIINLAILWIVVACNIIKMVVMAIVAFSTTLDQPLCTIGDAVSSFVTKPDPMTKDMCLVTRKDMLEYEASQRAQQDYNAQRYRGPTEPGNFSIDMTSWKPAEPHAWTTESNMHWYKAPSTARWWYAALLFTACLLTTIGLLGRAIAFYTGDKSISALAALGLGKPNSQTMITGWAISSIKSKPTAIVLAVLVANTPQIVLSFLYFSINGICTCMSLASEWGHFSYASAVKTQPRTLRTSEPCGEQRSTYFLQLPFRFAIPLIAMSALLHWLISQSIFVAVVTVYDELGNLKQNFAVATCGFSPFAMILVIVAGVALMAAIVGIGRFRLEEGMRLVGSSSAAISAACHLSERVEVEKRWEIVKGKIVWGDVGTQDDTMGMFVNDMTDVRHCTFASAAKDDWNQRVGPPQEGKKYS